jgi:hypothetical protein
MREERIARWVRLGISDEEGNVKLNPLKQIKTAEQGASTQVWAATSPLLEGKGGLYLENNNIAPRNEDIVVADVQGLDARGFFGVRAYARDPAAADRLWALTEKLTGVTFSI